MMARTADQAIRGIRAELHAKRCKDKDHSPSRMRADAQALDLDLWHLGVLTKRTTWSGFEQKKKVTKGEVTPA